MATHGSVNNVETVRNPLATLEADFDALVARMQTSAAKAAGDQLFAATPEELGQASVRGARDGS